MCVGFLSFFLFWGSDFVCLFRDLKGKEDEGLGWLTVHM